MSRMKYEYGTVCMCSTNIVLSFVHTHFTAYQIIYPYRPRAARSCFPRITRKSRSIVVPHGFLLVRMFPGTNIPTHFNLLHVLVSSESIGPCSNPGRAGGWYDGGNFPTLRQTPPAQVCIHRIDLYHYHSAYIRSPLLAPPPHPAATAVMKPRCLCRRLGALRVSLFGPLWASCRALKWCSDTFGGHQYI